MSYHLTVVIWADVQASSLAARHGLRNTKEGRAESLDAFGLENLGDVERGPRAGDLNAEAAARDVGALEFGIVEARVRQCGLGVVGLGRQRLQEHASRDHGDVFLAHEHGHARVDGQPAGVFELSSRLLEEFGIRCIAELNVHPQLVAGLVVELDLGQHRLDVLGVHPVNIDVD